jgi:hypothetical protein
MPRSLATLVVLLALCCALVAHADDAPPVRHAFIATDYSQAKVVIVTLGGRIAWEYDAPGCQDCWLLPNGDFLFSHVRGALEVTRDKRVVWEYKSPDGTEVHNCQPLPNGDVMVCECGSKRIIEIDRQGHIRKELKWETTTEGVHLQCRVARKLANGHYLIALTGEHVVRELDGTGTVVWEFATPGDPYVAVRLPDGNTLIGCGDGHTVVEVSPAKEIVWSLTENEIPGIPLRFMAGVQRLPNGNTVVCNWGGHGHLDEQPLAFEITRDKRVVWKVDDYARFRAFAGIQLFDVKGDVTKGQILR